MKKLPIQTVTIWISNMLQDYWWNFTCYYWRFFTLKRVTSKGKGQAIWHNTMLKLPVAGEIITMINVQSILLNFGDLTKFRRPYFTVFKNCKNLVSNVHMQQAVKMLN